ncbi:MAG: Rubrerythrin [Gemmatimonadetes bacterium]|nr:Rubrerythrin [Gemmatimonadota bacterium]
MPEFLNPFSGQVPDRKLTHGELVRAVRLNIAAEEEAIHLYMAHADATDHPLAKRVLIDVANEERAHVGEFSQLLQILTGDEDRWLADGAAEVDEIAAAMGGPAGDAGPTAQQETTIGSLREPEAGGAGHGE